MLCSELREALGIEQYLRGREELSGIDIQGHMVSHKRHKSKVGSPERY